MTTSSPVLQVQLGGWDALIAEHVVNGLPVLPGAALAEFALQGARRAGFDRPVLTEMVLVRPLPLAERARGRLDVDLERSPSGAVATLSFAGPDDPARALHARGRVEAGAGLPPALDLGALASRCTEVLSSGRFYEELAARGLAYGPAFRCVAECRLLGSDAALARLAPSPWVEADRRPFSLHPVLLDAAMQAVAVLGRPGAEGRGALVPYLFQRLEIGSPLDQAPAYSHVVLSAVGAGSTAGSVLPRAAVRVCRADGRVVALVDVVLARAEPRPAFGPAGASGGPRSNWGGVS